MTIDIDVKAMKADGQKCPRCGIYHMCNLNYDNLCDKCCHVLLEDWPDHEAIPGIKAAYESQRSKWSVKSLPPMVEFVDSHLDDEEYLTQEIDKLRTKKKELEQSNPDSPEIKEIDKQITNLGLGLRFVCS